MCRRRAGAGRERREDCDKPAGQTPELAHRRFPGKCVWYISYGPPTTRPPLFRHPPVWLVAGGEGGYLIAISRTPPTPGPAGGGDCPSHTARPPGLIAARPRLAVLPPHGIRPHTAPPRPCINMHPNPANPAYSSVGIKQNIIFVGISKNKNPDLPRLCGLMHIFVAPPPRPCAICRG